MSLATDLKEWRGKRGLKEVNELFGVTISTYHAWETGTNTPTELTERQIRIHMEADRMGIRPEVIKKSYWMVIKQVADEILKRKAA